MMGNFSFPENCKIVSATPITTTNATVTYDNICLKNAHKVWIVAYYLQTASHQTVLTPKIGNTDSCTTAITFSANWWLNSDTSTTDALTKQTAATTATLAAGTTNQIVVIEIDPADVAAQVANYDWLGATSATSSQSGNYVCAFYVIQERYQQTTPPTAIA